MGRVPHVFVARPWDSTTLAIPDDTRHHLRSVLRLGPGAPVTYTDGLGTRGSGTLQGDRVVRGAETSTGPPSPPITVAVAPPGAMSRTRFIVEKLAELGADRLVWLDAARSKGRTPRTGKSRAWAVAALQQSHGDRLLEMAGPIPPTGPWEAGACVYLADPEGSRSAPSPDPRGCPVVVLIGPEGGFTADEVPDGAIPISLGPRILRVETAAIVAGTLAVRER